MLPKVVISFGICKGRESDMLERAGVGDELDSIHHHHHQHHHHQNIITGVKAHQAGTTTRDEACDITFDRDRKRTIE